MELKDKSFSLLKLISCFKTILLVNVNSQKNKVRLINLLLCLNLSIFENINCE